MSDSIRSVTIVGTDGRQTAVPNLVGIDESTGLDREVVVAVRCTRDDDVRLVRALIENGLRPFRHKSSSLVRYGDLDRSERAARVEQLLSDLQQLPVTWSAVVCPTGDSQQNAAATAMAVKKSITNGLRDGVVAHGCGGTAILHDGKYDPDEPYFETLCDVFPSHFDTSFQRNICPVYLTFLRNADRIYPQNTTADYLAGYLRDRIQHCDDPVDFDGPIVDFDESWIDRAPQPEHVYTLEEIEPIRGERLRSRVIAWLTGQGYPADPTPTTRNPYQTLIDQIDDDVVYEYLSEEI